MRSKTTRLEVCTIGNAAKTYRKCVDSTRISNYTRYVNSFTSDDTHEKCIVGCFNSRNYTPIFTVYGEASRV